MGKEEQDNETVKVVVRIKPHNDRGRSCLHHTSDCELRCGADPQTYTFDKVAGETATQESVFKAAGEPLVDGCLEGFNCCIFTYGQTGSGKTWTMWGHLPDPDDIDELPEEAGLIPRMYERLFSRVKDEEKKMGASGKFTCKCSIIEIYNETITDLLCPDSGNLALRESKKDGVFIEGVLQRKVADVAAVMDLVSEGNENRQVAETMMNHESSRSHVVLICTIQWKTVDENGIITTKCSRLNLVDLAGSERQKSTQAKGDRLKEACGINKSLSTLGHVIMSLGDHQQGKDNHVPYRDSKLTFLLQDSLGGNSKTVMIACLSPSLKNMEETLSTLRFARGAKRIKNKAVINESLGGDVTALREEIAKLKAEIAQLKSREAERNTKGPSGAITPTSIDSYALGSGGMTPTSTTFTLTDSRSDMMEDFDDVYTLRTERNCAACREMKAVLKQVWEEKAQVLEDSILLAAQLTAARLEVDTAQSECSRAVERQKRMGEEVIAQLVSELELVKGAQKEESPLQISHAQAKMALARRRSMKAVHSTSRDWSSEGVPGRLEEWRDEREVLRQLSIERNMMNLSNAQKSPAVGNESPDSQESAPSADYPASPSTEDATALDIKRVGSLSPSAGNREAAILDDIEELPEDECLEPFGDEVHVQDKELDDIMIDPMGNVAKEGDGESGIYTDPLETHVKEGEDEPYDSTVSISKDTISVGNSENPENMMDEAEPVSSEGSVPVTLPAEDFTVSDEQVKDGGAGGMRRGSINISAGVREIRVRQLDREIIPVIPVSHTSTSFDASPQENKQTFMHWITSCFGGLRTRVTDSVSQCTKRPRKGERLGCCM